MPVDAMAGVSGMKKWQVAALAGIMVFGSVLRLYHLGWQCLNVDEMVTYRVVGSKSALDLVLWALGSDYNPPLYYLCAHLSSVILNNISLFSVRFPAVVFGVLLIPSVYALGNQIRNTTLGLLLAAASSFMFPFVYYSQNARAYSLVMLAFVWYIIFYIKVYRGDVGYKTIMLFVLFACLCLWSHLYSVIPLMVSLAFLALKYRKTIPYLAGVIAVVCLPFIRYIPAIYNQIFNPSGMPVLHNYFWFSPQQIALMLPNELFCWAWILVIPLVIFSLWKHKSSLHISLFIISAITVLSCIPMTFITSMSPRYALLVSPVLLVLALYPVSAWIDAFKSIEKRAVLFIAVVFILFLFNWGSLLSWYTFNVCPYI